MKKDEAIEEIIVLGKKIHNKRYSLTNRKLMTKRMFELITKFNITYGDTLEKQEVRVYEDDKITIEVTHKKL